MDVDDRHADRLEEVGRQDLHVARQDDEVEVAGQQLDLAALGLGLRVAGDRDVDERHAERAHVVGEVGVVGDHEADVEVELVAARAPEQVEQAVVVAADHDRPALGHAGVGERPLHPERPADLGGEAALELVAHRRQARRGERPSRRKNEPPSGSVEYWSDSMMFAPCSKRKRETAATIPGRSGHDTSSRPMSGVRLRRVTAANLPAPKHRAA